MTAMKTRHILTSIATLLTVFSCVEGPSDIGEQTEGGLLKVQFDIPELMVKSGDEAPIFHAYISSELQAGNVNPIGYTDMTSDGYYLYNLPEGTTDVVFTNISNDTGSVRLKTDEAGRTVFELDSYDPHPMFDTELLYGTLSGVNTGASHDVGIERLSTTLSHYFYLIDSEGNSLPTDEILNVAVSYSGLGGSMTVAEDGTVSASASEQGNSYGYVSVPGAEDNHMFTKNIIPTATPPTMHVTVTFTNGNVKQYEKPLTQAFESNHHYTVNLRLKQLNGDATFTLEEPEVYTNYYYPYFSAQEFFNLTGGTTVGSSAGDKLVIDVDTALPYEWVCTHQDNGFFTIEVVDGQIVITALSDNVNETRSVTITLSTAEGYTETITVNQKNSLKHRIVMTSQHDYSYTYVSVTGENITVQDPNDSAPVLYEGTSDNRYIYIDGLTNGAQVIIEGDVITGFRAAGYENGSYTDSYGYTFDSYSETEGYYYGSSSRYYNSFAFENCIYLEDLVLQGYDATVDVSGMPQLKRLHIQQNSSLTSVVFAENQSIEHLTLFNCDALTGVDVSNIASAVKSINMYDCDGLTGSVINNCTALEAINLNYCSAMKVINLTGCNALETLYIQSNTAKNLILTDCSALKDLTLKYMTLTKITNDGVDNIENIYTSDLSISTFDFSGKTSLKTIGYINSVETLNVSNCTSLSDLTAYMNSSVTQSVNLEGSGLNSLTLYDLNTDCDYSTLSGLKKLYLYDIRPGVSALALSSCSSLEELYARYYSYYASSDEQHIESLSLPQSIKKLNMYYLHGLTGTLDLSGMSALTELDFYHIGSYGYNGQYLTSVNLSGCTSLKSVNRNDSDNELDDWNSPYCYNITSIDLTDCQALEYFNMRNSDISSLDFSACTAGNSLYYVDVMDNNMDAAAIDNMIATFPDRQSSPTQGVYVISGNPGADSHNETVANEKGWWL